jgi:hypothetical protein
MYADSFGLILDFKTSHVMSWAIQESGIIDLFLSLKQIVPAQRLEPLSSLRNHIGLKVMSFLHIDPGIRISYWLFFKN